MNSSMSRSPGSWFEILLPARTFEFWFPPVTFRLLRAQFSKRYLSRRSWELRVSSPRLTDPKSQTDRSGHKCIRRELASIKKKVAERFQNGTRLAEL